MELYSTNANLSEKWLLCNRHNVICLESYDRIEQTLKHCIEAKMLPADLMTRRAAIIMRYISGLMENWLFARNLLILKEARDYVAILLEMYLLCPLRNPATNE
ncbi:HTH-type transcriptional regulator AcrR [Escherichia coli]|nr:HTH-type transcriptional regulator AcrR [Escherichia coli]